MRLPHYILPLAILLAACGPAPSPATDAPGSGPPELSDLTGQALAASTLGPDPYEIGTSWYDYTQRTHVLTPREHVYVLRREGTPRAMFEITSYYDERGESGRFTLRSRTYEGSMWSAVRVLASQQNVKEGNMCLSDVLDEVACDAQDAFLIFRIVRRALPDAGFAVKDPGVFLLSQFQDNPTRDELLFFEASNLEAMDMDALDFATAPARPSSAADPVHSRIGWIHDAPGAPPRTDVHFQVTTSLHASLWQATGIARDVESNTTSITIDALCQRVNFANQRSFSPDARRSFTLTLPTQTPYSAAQVTLCDADGETGVLGTTRDLTTSPYSGQWGEDPPFDLFVEQIEGRISLRLAPGNLLWNWSASEAGQLNAASLDDPLDPEAVWDTFYAL